MQLLTVLWTQTELALSAHVVLPLLNWLHLAQLAGDPREIAEFLMISITQVGIIALVFRPLESIVPVERWANRQGTRIDVVYTCLKLLGLVPIFTFLILLPLTKFLGTQLDVGGTEFTRIDVVFPWFRQHPLLLFLVYFAIIDLAYYFVHRLQHAIPWWWALHSLHHSQRQVSCWTNDRDHFLDDAFEALIVGGVSLAIGVAPTQYVVLVVFGQLLENFSHTNVRFGFGPILDKVLVDPRYHRLHHMRADPARPGLHDCNFSVIFPLWDILFGTALYGQAPRPCGVGDPAIDADNNLGLVAQQLAGLARFWRALKRSVNMLAVSGNVR
jgi:sterol desaturase/sphingolipid hydroxylase (fatty acid hydroxylase superfamily)